MKGFHTPRNKEHESVVHSILYGDNKLPVVEADSDVSANSADVPDPLSTLSETCDFEGDAFIDPHDKEDADPVFLLEGDEDEDLEELDDIEDFFKDVQGESAAIRSVADALLWTNAAMKAKLPGRSAYTGQSERSIRRLKARKRKLEESSINNMKSRCYEHLFRHTRSVFNLLFYLQLQPLQQCNQNLHNPRDPI